jgi:acetyl-CoA carboxylase carboxyl transferase subunit alpha
LTATDMKKAKLIDKIIKEPLGGAHYDRQQVFDSVQDEVLKTFKVLDKLEPLELIKNRRAKFNDMGVFKD